MEQQNRNRALLLDAAAGVFAQHGYDGASLEAIANAAGLSKGAVYSNFETKEDLYLTLIDDRIAAQLEYYAEVLAGEAALEVRLERFAAAWEHATETDRQFIPLYLEFWLSAARSAEVRAELAERERFAVNAVASLIAREAEREGLDLTITPDQLAVVVAALADGLAMRKFTRDEAVPDGTFAAVLRTIVAGMRSAQPRNCRS